MKRIFIFLPPLGEQQASDNDITKQISKEDEKQLKAVRENLPEAFNLVLSLFNCRGRQTAELLSRADCSNRNQPRTVHMGGRYEPHNTENLTRKERKICAVEHNEVASNQTNTTTKPKSDSRTHSIRETIKKMDNGSSVLIVTNEMMARAIILGLKPSQIYLTKDGRDSTYARHTVENLHLQPCEGVCLELDVNNDLVNAEYITPFKLN